MKSDDVLRYEREKREMWQRLDMLSNGFLLPTKKPFGGTLRHKLRDAPNWPHLKCTHCFTPFHKHYYTHQCRWRMPHMWCYKCLRQRGRCTVCHQLYTKILKSYL